MGRVGRRLRIAAWVLGPVGLVLMVGAVVLIGTGYSMTTITSSAMGPTHSPGERVLLERIDADAVRRGDVVVYRMADRYQGQAVLQRVIGVGGDHVAQKPGAPVTVNEKPLTEPYVKADGPFGMTPEFDVVVPEGRLFLLGDNRANANDSRFFLSEQSGTVPATTVEARVLDSRTGLLGVALTGLLGLLLALGAVVVQVVARGTRQRSLPGPVPLNPSPPADAQRV